MAEPCPHRQCPVNRIPRRRHDQRAMAIGDARNAHCEDGRQETGRSHRTAGREVLGAVRLKLLPIALPSAALEFLPHPAASMSVFSGLLDLWLWKMHQDPHPTGKNEKNEKNEKSEKNEKHLHAVFGTRIF